MAFFKQTEDTIPEGKLKRSAITGASAARVGLKHLGYLGTSPFISKHQKDQRKSDHEEEMGKILIGAFSQLRGTALKLGQMLSMEKDFLPENIRKELMKACHQVVPLNKAHVRKMVKSEFGVAPTSLFKEFNSNAFAAASLGQVHRAELPTGEDVAVKIQYPGIGSSIKSDITMIKGLLGGLSLSTPLVPPKKFINKVLGEMEVRLNEEVDYTIEAANTEWFAQNLNLPGIVTPTVHQEFSSDKVITTSMIEGVHLKQWLESNPSQAERNEAGQKLFDLFIHQVFDLHCMHADPHPGNYLFQKSGTIAMIDYGCIKKLDPNFLNIITRLYSNDERKVFEAYNEFNIVSDMSFEEFSEKFYTIIKPIHKYIISPLSESPFDFSKMKGLNIQDHKGFYKIAKKFRDLNEDQIYFDRTYLGLINMLREIGAVVKTENSYLFG